jgi:hypothetical protein
MSPIASKRLFGSIQETTPESWSHSSTSVKVRRIMVVSRQPTVFPSMLGFVWRLFPKAYIQPLAPFLEILESLIKRRLYTRFPVNTTFTSIPILHSTSACCYPESMSVVVSCQQIRCIALHPAIPSTPEKICYYKLAILIIFRRRRPAQLG